MFILIYRMHSAPGSVKSIWKPVYKSEIKNQTLNSRSKPTFIFNQFSILVSDVCGGDEDKEVKMEIFRSQKNGRHQNQGSVLFTIAELKNYQQEPLAIVKQKNATLNFDVCKIQKRNSFLEYIFGGCELNLAIAIDFTLSNGEPKDRDSLHYMGNMKGNEYYNAIKSVGEILEFYDADKQFPTLGFGAKIDDGLARQAPSHCFALNGNIFDPECEGIDGVLEAYKASLAEVKLYGPTHFNEILGMSNDMAEGLEVSQRN